MNVKIVRNGLVTAALTFTLDSYVHSFANSQAIAVSKPVELMDHVADGTPVADDADPDPVSDADEQELQASEEDPWS